MVVHTLLDFLYLAQLPSHSSNTLTCMEDLCLASMTHDNKDVFVNLRIHNHFKYPKLHLLLHYVPLIQLFSTTDNYKTEQMEWFHVDTTRVAYNVTNHKDKYHQMTTWMEHCENTITFLIRQMMAVNKLGKHPFSPSTHWPSTPQCWQCMQVDNGSNANTQGHLIQ